MTVTFTPPNLPIYIFSQIGQAEEVIQYFNGKTNGVFVEAGAWDGEYLSNTLFLEVSSQQYLVMNILNVT